MTITPGKHSNDQMYSFYFRNPSGWMFEYGYGGRPATHQSEYYVEDVYGHHHRDHQANAVNALSLPRQKCDRYFATKHEEGG